MDFIEIILYGLIFLTMGIPAWIAIALCVGISRDHTRRQEAFSYCDQWRKETTRRIHGNP